MAGVPIVDRLVCTALAVAHGRVSASGGCGGAMGRRPRAVGRAGSVDISAGRHQVGTTCAFPADMPGPQVRAFPGVQPRSGRIEAPAGIFAVDVLPGSARRRTFGYLESDYRPAGASTTSARAVSTRVADAVWRVREPRSALASRLSRLPLPRLTALVPDITLPSRRSRTRPHDPGPAPSCTPPAADRSSSSAGPRLPAA